MTRSQLILAILAGLVISIDNMISIVAFSSLIYQGALEIYIPLVINILAISVIIISASYLFMSSLLMQSLSCKMKRQFCIQPWV